MRAPPLLCGTVPEQGIFPMLRIALIDIFMFSLPFLIYGAYMLAAKGAAPTDVWQDAPVLWLLAAGYGAWCSGLVFIYALHALGCTFGWPTSALRLSLGVVLAVHLAVIGWLWRDLASVSPDPALGPTGSFLHWVAVWTLITAFVTTVLTLGPTLLLKTCV